MSGYSDESDSGSGGEGSGTEEGARRETGGTGGRDGRGREAEAGDRQAAHEGGQWQAGAAQSCNGGEAGETERVCMYVTINPSASPAPTL